jgi:prepilin-type processing-associated H-X9-DG protein
VLISILLPALGNARRSANTAKCAANLRSIVQGMNIYAANWAGAIPGSAWTSARFVDPANMSQPSNQALIGRFQSVISISDWMSPIAKSLGVKFNEGPTEADRLARFQQLRVNPIFNCPENEFLAGQFSATTPGGSLIAPTGLMISYNTPSSFFVRNTPIPRPSNWNGYQEGRATAFAVSPTLIPANPPPGYNVTLGKVGNAARKVFIADGAKYTNGSSPPSFNLGVDVRHGGAFGDQPPVTGYTASWGRSRAPANNTFATGATDERVYAFRHGKVKKDARADTGYQINVAFFDGHVSLMGDLEACDPDMWYPRGTVLSDIGGTSGGTPQVYPDVRNKYLTGLTTYTVP